MKDRLTDKPHILIVGSLPPPFGGGEIMMQNTRDVLRKMGFPLEIVNTSSHYFNKDRGRITIRLLLRYAKIYSSLFFTLLLKRVDFVYFSLSKVPKAFVINIPYILISKLFGKKLMGHIHGGEFHVIDKKLLRKFVKRVDIILVLSDHVKRQLEKVLKKESFLILNGISASNKAQSCKDQIRKMLFVGNLVESKGIFRIARIFSAVAKLHKEIELYLIGEWHDESDKNRFYSLFQSEELRERIVEVGYVGHEVVLSYYERCDLLLHPSDYDGQPIAIIEALSYGMPVISTRVGGIPLLVKNGCNGVTIENPNEIESLFRELLIGVTNFFRDADSFNVLKTKILPEFFDSLQEDATFRAWIPGCSTGEEVYSLAIVFREVLDKNPRRINLQLFGTDIDNHAIDKARDGIFPASISTDINKERLKRFFIKEGEFYRIRKEIRDNVVFSVQDVIKDPPFSRLDLLCCRNLLIYLDTNAQKKLLPLFHYTLKPNGILILGSSETIGGFSNLFETLDKKWKIFRRQDVPQALRPIVEFPNGYVGTEPAIEKTPVIQTDCHDDINFLTQTAILKQFAPTAILINGGGDILNVQGRTGKFLETPSGPPTHNILDLARKGLRIELSSALRAAKATSKQVTRKRIAVKTNGDMQLIDMHVCPQKTPEELAGRLLVVFEEIDVDHEENDSGVSGTGTELPDASRIAELERELQVTRESHQTTIEELESSNEELKSTNEEMQSSNEELQSTNEELESSKEELQSLNEELQTVNSELQSKVEELSATHDDMRNLMNSTEIATIFVDNDMRIRRFTDKATSLVNMIQTDIGRPLQHVVSNLNYEKMIADLTEVVKNLAPKECEVQTVDEKWFNMRIIPYRTTDNRIDGAVLTFSSIDDQKMVHTHLQNSLSESETAWELVRAIFDISEEPMLVLDKNGRIVIANTRYTELMGVDQEKLKGTDFLRSHKELAGQIDLKTKLKAAFEKNKSFTSDLIDIKTPAGENNFTINGRILKGDQNIPYRILIQFIPKT